MAAPNISNNLLIKLCSTSTKKLLPRTQIHVAQQWRPKIMLMDVLLFCLRYSCNITTEHTSTTLWIRNWAAFPVKSIYCWRVICLDVFCLHDILKKIVDFLWKLLWLCQFWSRAVFMCALRNFFRIPEKTVIGCFSYHDFKTCA